MIKRLFGLLAICALLLAGCGDDSEGGLEDADTDSTEEPDESTTSTTEEEAGGLTLDEWVESADEICEEANDATDELGEPVTVDEIVALLPEALPIIQEQIEALEDLGPPDESAEEVEEAIGLLDDQVALLEEALDRIDDGEDPETVFEDINDEGEEMEADLDDLAEELGMEVCGGEIGEDDDTTSTTTDGGSDGDEPFTYGDDPELDALWDDCEAGDADACDSLWLESPVDSEYEEFGYSCGFKVPEGEAMSCAEVLGDIDEEEPTSGEPFTYGDDPELDALWDDCEGGDPDACNQLFLDSPSGSEYEDFGWSCGGRVPEDEIEICSDVM